MVLQGVTVKSLADAQGWSVRNAYRKIKGDPLFDPNRHARVGVVKWTADGPDFGVPEPDNLWTPTTTDVLPADGGPFAGTPAVAR